MQCGAKIFHIEYEEDGVIKNIQVKARNQALARKVFREEMNRCTIMKCIQIKNK